MVHSFCVIILYFPVRLSIYGALLMCHHFIFFLLGCLSMVHSLCVIILYFPVRFSFYGALVFCHHFIFSC